MNKTIAIYFSEEAQMGSPINLWEYLEIYQYIIDNVEKQGVDVYIVRGNSYLGNGRFKKGWRMKNQQVTESQGAVQADLIWNRDDMNTIPVIRDCKIINDPDFDQFCCDKVKTFQTFPEFSPKTASVHSYDAYLNTLKEWDTQPDDMIVLKKNFQTGGTGITVMHVHEVTEALYPDWKDLLVQEFLDSSIGIPGVTNGMHDLRITHINGKPINCYVRIPKPGSYLANISQGASVQAFPFEKVPPEVMKMDVRIAKKLSQYIPSVYSADYINSPKGFRLVELNSRPGLHHPTWISTYKIFNDGLVDMLVDAVKE